MSKNLDDRITKMYKIGHIGNVIGTIVGIVGGVYLGDYLVNSSIELQTASDDVQFTLKCASIAVSGMLGFSIGGIVARSYGYHKYAKKYMKSKNE